MNCGTNRKLTFPVMIRYQYAVVTHRPVGGPQSNSSSQKMELQWYGKTIMPQPVSSADRRSRVAFVD